MPRVEKPSEGSWTAHYPELGTGPVSYEDSITPEVHDRERDAIFKRSWLNVGRVEQLPRRGSYFTKELAVANTSVVIVLGTDGEIRAFHNICRHRGNKLVWTDFPREESHGNCRQFVCKYHGWKYELDGSCAFVQQEDEFFDLDKADYGLVPVHCDVWSGFIFVNLAAEPGQTLAEFLGPMITALDGYPFDQMTERFFYRAEVGSNWKLFMDAFQEFYHAPVLHAKQSPVAARPEVQAMGYEGLHYEIDGPHRLVTSTGGQGWKMPPEALKPMETVTRSGLFGPWDAPELGELPRGVNPAQVKHYGLDSYQIWPNFVILIWERGWYLTYHYWPTSYNTHVFEGNLYFVPAKNARERLAHEMAAVTFKEYALQDGNTLEATQIMLESRVVTAFPLNDQEVLCRHLHKVAADWIADYERELAERRDEPGADPEARLVLAESHGRSRAGGRSRMTTALLPGAFSELELFATAWCLATERERFARRMASSMDEMQAFYDAFLPRAEEAIAYCEKFPLDDMAEDAERLLQLLYSLVMVSFPVEAWRQPNVPDSGAAYLDLLIEPLP